MPKEITHWSVADRLLKHLPPAFSAPAKAHHNLYLLGAMAPDILFYYKNGPEQKLFRKTAEALHGEYHSDTYGPLKALIRRYSPSLPEPVHAFICGYVSHITADGAFHPLVLHYAGNNKYDHHAIETILDLFFKKNSCPPGIKYIGKLLRRVEISRSDLLNLLGLALFSGNEYPQRQLVSGLRQYRFTQRLFWSRFGCWVIRHIARLDATAHDSVSSYYQREFNQYASTFANPIPYLHPVTGEAFHENATDIEKKAVEKAAAAIERIFRLKDTAKWPADAESLLGPNLFTGLPGDSPTQTIHFSPGGAAALFGNKYSGC